MEEPRNPFLRFMNSLYYVLDAPVTYVREKIIEPNRQPYPYYHRKYNRVATIDECYLDDKVCRFEANQQFLRDKSVDSEILKILRKRYEHCNHEDPNQRGEKKCEDIYEYYKDAAGAWNTKYGDLGPKPNVWIAFMKQKHRMIWERRHGPVGSGMKRGIEIEDESQ